ncbi:MAG: DUF1849 family protein [Rhodospirillales bacterium]|nr:DUF1849 family protein [Rhodospirillales bacterium]
MSLRKAFLPASAVVLAGSVFTLSVDAADLVAHSAVYEMTLGEHESRTGLISIHGGMLLEIEDHCETWAVRRRLAMQITGDDGTHSTTSSIDFFQSKDGSWYRFDDETAHSPGGIERFSGEASIADETRSGRISIEQPEESRHNLPDKAVFPMVHLSDLIDRAAAGERFMSHVVYDGTDGAKVYDVTTIVGSAVENDGMVSWPMRLAFYEHGTVAEQPEVEIAAVLREDGVAESLSYDYGTFVIDLTLVELTELDGGC